MAVHLSACESLNPFNWFDSEEPESPYAGQEAPGADQDYPRISSVPERPAEGLIADTRDRLYEEEQQNKQEADALGGPPPPAIPQEPTPAPVQPVDTVSPPPLAPPLADQEPSSQSLAAADKGAEVVADQRQIPDDMRLAETTPKMTEGAETTELVATSLPPEPERRFVSIKMGTLFFPFGSSYISPEDRRHVQKIVTLAKEKDAILRIIGYASSFTQDMSLLDHQVANFSVSLQRAQAVANLILANGFDRDRLLINALSDADPLFLEVMPAGRRGNQRAEIHMEY